MASTIESGKHTLEHGQLTGSTFHDVCLGDTVFDDVNFKNVKIHNANMSDAYIEDVNLTNVRIRNANHTGMTLGGVMVSDLFEAYRKQQQPGDG